MSKHRHDRMTIGDYEWELGVIKRAEIEMDSAFTFWLHFDFNGTGQGLGGIALDDWSPEDRRRIGHAAGADAIAQIMRVMGVTKWRDIDGKLAWAIRRADDRGGWMGQIVGIARPWALGGDVWMLSDWRRRWFETEACR